MVPCKDRVLERFQGLFVFSGGDFLDHENISCIWFSGVSGRCYINGGLCDPEDCQGDGAKAQTGEEKEILQINVLKRGK